MPTNLTVSDSASRTGEIVADTVEEIVPGLVVESYLGGRVVSYKLTSISRSIIDQWADAVIQRLAAWPQGQPYCAQHDVSMPGIALQYGCLTDFDTMNVGITPAGRSRVYELIEQHDRYAHIALNFNLALSGHVNKVLADNRTMIRRSRHPQVTYRSFYSADKALEWLVTSSETVNSSFE